MSSRRVLVVDDERDYLKLMAGHLARKGFEVEMAENGRQALDLIEGGGRFEVMVVDLMMPEVNGIELIRRGREADPWMESIVVSGAGTLESAISSMRQGGAFDYLPKPLEAMTDLSLAVGRAAEFRQIRLEREQLQEQIAAERQRLNTIIANAGEAMISCGGDGLIAVANSTATELFGQADLVGQVALEVLPPALASVATNWLAFDRQRSAVTEVRWPPGTVHMVSLTPIHADPGDQGTGWVMVLRDVTPLRRMSEQKMRLLARAADQVRTPLAEAFSAVVELNELPEAGNERFTGIVEKQVDRLSAIRTWTDDLLALVQIEAGEAESAEPVSLNDLVLQAEPGLHDGLVGAKQLELVLEADGQPGVTIDRGLGRRLVEHMVRQAAWRAAPKGRIGLSLTSRQNQTWLQIHDDGPRLRASDGTELFESFASRAGDLGEGAGISLATVKSIADVIGGQVWLSSHSPDGNTLSVSFASEEA
jgi:PAS domain S-box-containing protein